MMADGIRQAAVAIMMRREHLRVRRDVECVYSRLRVLEPEEIAAELRLVLAIHRDRVVSGCAAEVATPQTFCVIGERAGIYQDRFSRHTQRKSQGIGVPVRGY